MGNLVLTIHISGEKKGTSVKNPIMATVQDSHVAECCIVDSKVLLAGCITNGVRIILVKLSSPYTNLALPRPSTACIILIWCAGICLLPVPSIRGVFTTVLTKKLENTHKIYMPNSLRNHLYVSFITNCVLAKVYLFLPLCETMSVLQLLPLRPTGLWSADITWYIKRISYVAVTYFACS